MASRQVSTMIKQGYISDISLSLSPLRTTALFNKPSSPIASPNDSTRSSHSNPTLLDMISDEQNRETKRDQDEPRRKSHPRVAKILVDFKNGVEPGDVKLSLVSRDGYRVTMDVHKKVLSEKSRFFLEKMKSESQMVEISECDDVDVYVETVVLMYCDDLKNKLVGENVIKVLALLKVSSAITFDEGIKSCLEYLEAVPWSEDEEQIVVSCIEKLDLSSSSTTSVLQRVVSSSEPSKSSSITNDIFLKLLSSVCQAKDDKASREMKSVIFHLIREEADHDVSKDILYSQCHHCLLYLILCLSEVTSHMNDPSDLVGEIAREASNLLWIVDILIEKNICDEFVKLWADQKELANLHSKIPAMYRHEISKITAEICVGIGKGKILVKRETRYSVLKTWLEALYDDFGWMRRASSRSMDWNVVEDGLSQMILTLSLRQQQAILMKWFDRFMSKGDECPNVQRAFEVWWRRAFIRQVIVEPTDASQLQHEMSTMQDSTSSIKAEWNLHMEKTESSYHEDTSAVESGKKAMQEVLLNCLEKAEMSAHQWRKAQESLVSLERNNVASVDSIVRGGMDANENLRSQFSSAVSSSLDVFDAANGSLLTSIDQSLQLDNNACEKVNSMIIPCCEDLIELKSDHNHKIVEITENAGKCLLDEYVVDEPSCSTPRKRPIDIPSIESIEELRTPASEELLRAFRDEKLLKQANGDAKQQQQQLIRASSLYEAAVSDSRFPLSAVN